MSLKKIGQYINNRLSLFVGIGMIISIHWGWYQLQTVPYLVPQDQRKDFPLLAAIKAFSKKLSYTDENKEETKESK